MNTFQLQRRQFALGAIASVVIGAPVMAQTALPDVLSLIVPYPAGGSSDVVARILQPTMAKALGKTLVVENVSGVAGSLGAQKMLSAAIPGQSILVGSPNEVILAQMALKVIKYKSQDFKLVAHLARASVVVFARTELPANNLEELIKLAKAPNAKPLTHANSGKGSIFHLVSESFSDALGLNMTQIPYKGGAPAIQDLAGNQVDVMFGPVVPQYLQMVEAGRMKIIGVATSQRLSSLPKVQAFGEIPALKGSDFEAWVGIFVPANTNNEIAAKIGKAAYEAAATKEFHALLKASGNSAGSVLSLDELATLYKSETERYQRIAKSIKLESE